VCSNKQDAASSRGLLSAQVYKSGAWCVYSKLEQNVCSNRRLHFDYSERGSSQNNQLNIIRKLLKVGGPMARLVDDRHGRGAIIFESHGRNCRCQSDKNKRRF